jgi:hypothetical protein
MDDTEIRQAIKSAVREAIQLARTNSVSAQGLAVEYAEQLILPAHQRSIAQARAEGYRAGVGGRAEPVS